MATDQFGPLITQISVVHHYFAMVVDTGFLILCRLMGFMLVGPVFGRKDIPFPVKLGIALMLSAVLVWTFPVTPAQQKLIDTENSMPWYLLQIFLNVSIGLFIGFIGAAIMEAINSAGSLMNNQIGLSSAMMFDPSTRQQVALTEKIFAYIGILIFFQIGGIYWILDALTRSFEVFPIYALKPDLTGQISLDYVVQVTGNSLAVGTQLVAPVMVVTMAVDMILGIVNRTAQQIQVFQLSFALKPCIGLAAFLATLPIFIKLVQNYLSDYASIF